MSTKETLSSDGWFLYVKEEHEPPPRLDEEAISFIKLISEALETASA